MQILPSYKELKNRFPLTERQFSFIEQSRLTVSQILQGLNSKLLLIVGPCSIHDRLSAKEFAYQLKNLTESVHAQFFPIMRVYCEKPRTLTGWKGFLYDPHLDGSSDILTGLCWTRQLLLELADLEIPAAAEFLDPLTAFYYDDLITWGSIGARTSSSQPHRQLAANLAMPVGIKNGVAGNLSAAINGVNTAFNEHTYMGLNSDGHPAIIHAKGNPNAHVVLRGGENGPNYDPSFVSETLFKLEQAGLPPCLLIDCSHQNSGKCYDKQGAVFQSVLHQVVEGNTSIRGLLLESHLYAGNQPLKDPQQLLYGVSITDGCLDWHSTAHLIEWGTSFLTQQRVAPPLPYILN